MWSENFPSLMKLISSPHVSKFLRSPIESIAGQSPRDKLLFVIGLSAIVWYFVSISCIGFEWVQQSEIKTPSASTVGTTTGIGLHAFMSFSVTTISGTLATYMGMVLGFGQKQDQANGVQVTISTLQKWAAWSYFVSLLYALVIWGVSKATEDKSVITTLGQSILGLFGGTLAVILNVEPPSGGGGGGGGGGVVGGGGEAI